MFQFKKKETQKDANPLNLGVRNEIVATGENVTKAGYYLYNGHVKPEEKKESCVITSIAGIKGLFLAEGSPAPDSGACTHKINWRYDKELNVARKMRISGEIVIKSGYYVYTGHLNESEMNNCFIPPKVILGLYLSQGSLVPELVNCGHKAKWEFSD